MEEKFTLIPEVSPETKICVSCKERKELKNYRTYGKGRRSICKDCESSELQPEEPVIEDELKVKSSLGFKASVHDGDTYMITQNDVTITLQPHEVVALINWLNEKLSPDEVER